MGRSAVTIRTRPCHALDFDFVVEMDDVGLRDHLDEIFAGFPGPEASEAPHEYTLRCTDDPPTRVEIRLDGEPLARFVTVAAAVAHLLWDLNRRVVASSDRFVLVHAGAVARRGPALVLPAPMESGKTTLVAGLLCAGFSYLTDEAAAIDPDVGSVTPYPKALHLDEGSWALFPDLAPQPTDRRQSYVRTQWHVPPGRVGARVASTVPLGAVVFPRYERGVATALTPMSTASALVELIANCFNFAGHAGAQGLAAMASVLAGARCHRLAVGDLDRACRLLIELDDDIADADGADEVPEHDREATQ